jgi:hypothetical protein
MRTCAGPSCLCRALYVENKKVSLKATNAVDLHNFGIYGTNFQRERGVRCLTGVVNVWTI